MEHIYIMLGVAFIGLGALAWWVRGLALRVEKMEDDKRE